MQRNGGIIIDFELANIALLSFLAKGAEQRYGIRMRLRRRTRYSGGKYLITKDETLILELRYTDRVSPRCVSQMESQVQVVLHQMPHAEVAFFATFRNALDWLEILALRLIKVSQDDFNWDLYFRQYYGLCLALQGTW